jgi:hypothetical protein
MTNALHTYVDCDWFHICKDLRKVNKYDMIWCRAALFKNYHQEHSIEPRRIPKDVAATWGAEMLRFHGVSNLYK